MNRGKFKKKTKGRLALFLLLLLLLLLCLSVGGVAAYLSMSSNVAQNTFTAANQPSVTVTDTTVTVAPNGYGVYLRLAVDVYWKHQSEENVILAEEPAAGYSVGGNGWRQIGNFYYYTSVITEPTTLALPVVLDNSTSGDYKLAANVAAQVVQAVGTVDDGTKTAVEDAWGVTPQQITD